MILKKLLRVPIIRHLLKLGRKVNPQTAHLQVRRPAINKTYAAHGSE